ncbi:Protein-tyrosine-phosphatase [Nitrosococcus halophilus Nc 4]|uniref:protein-tyrosine-phosphatase n=1 Tax=Nitrosococcus halophilus (strain Nc4) TaxID=472759 RepID=D5C0E0_NITHN|nr:CpsB/CapC family capsule biosynthesis tyrosine phosphatase [Nitrosococcus halophilus]ADE14466.1 Protein-tyrosine-phosphatase [Nitrosococcus halophilus Nc 4]
MIDLHCHILPGIDDGASDLETALAMARLAVSDQITTIACTPHIYLGLYDNTVEGIQTAMERLRQALAAADIELELVMGADIQITPDLRKRLQAGEVPTLNSSRYFLFEPPHHVCPPRFSELAFNLSAYGYVPIITHPERLTWIGDHYELFVELALKGVWMQVTAGSLSGRFGRRARYWGERMLDEGLVHLLATDAHGLGRRPPLLSEGVMAAEKWVSAEEARQLVEGRPQAVLANQAPDSVPQPPALNGGYPAEAKPGGMGRRLSQWLGLGR